MPEFPEGLPSRDNLIMALTSIKNSDNDDAVVKKTFGIFATNNAPKGTVTTQNGVVISESRFCVSTPATARTTRVKLAWIESGGFHITDEDAKVWVQVRQRAIIIKLIKTPSQLGKLKDNHVEILERHLATVRNENEDKKRRRTESGLGNKGTDLHYNWDILGPQFWSCTDDAGGPTKKNKPSQSHSADGDGHEGGERNTHRIPTTPQKR